MPVGLTESVVSRRMVMKAQTIGLLMLLAPCYAGACPLKVVTGDGGSLSVVNTADGSSDYVYAAVVQGNQPLTRLEDIMASGQPLERMNAKAKKYALPKHASGASLYLVTSPERLDAHDRFRVSPAAEKEARELLAAAKKSGRSRGMSNYGGPLPEPAVSAPDVASPNGIDVCTARIEVKDKHPLVSADLP